tara:strand:+ start:4025 stop:4222 length:198 start_codon:yes stop_codon:yes gene_type:complete
MVNIIKSDTNTEATIDVDVVLDRSTGVKVTENLDHLIRILKYQHEELGKNITGVICLHENDNKET